MKAKAIISIIVLPLIASSCSKEIEGPEFDAPASMTIAQGVALESDQLFGVWEGTSAVGDNNTNHFEQSYRVEFQSVDDGEAIISHWFTDASSSTRDSVCNLEYRYRFDGSVIELQPKSYEESLGASAIKAVHIGNNVMNLYTTNGQITGMMCTLTRTGDPEPSITHVDKTLPQPGEKVTFTGRNLQFVDHLFLPTAEGEIEVKDFTASSKYIQFIIPEQELAPGYVRFHSSGAHVSAYSPAMFCHNCVFFHKFSTEGTEKPYIGTEFENSIDITQNLFDKISVVSSANLPEGHCLSLASTELINPTTMLCYFGDTPIEWPVDAGLDPDTGMLRFSFGDRMQYVVDHSDGLISEKTKCKDVAIEMDIYVYSDGIPVWDTGFISFRLDKDQSKSLSQAWFAQTALWNIDEPVTFDKGWQTFKIPLSEFKVTDREAYATVGSLMKYLKNNKKQSIIKLINHQLDATHPAHPLNSFQFCIANMRLVPSAIPSNRKDDF